MRTQTNDRQLQCNNLHHDAPTADSISARRSRCDYHSQLNWQSALVLQDCVMIAIEKFLKRFVQR